MPPPSFTGIPSKLSQAASQVPSEKVLNPTLYKRLVAVFGQVKISKQGVPFSGVQTEWNGRILNNVCRDSFDTNQDFGETYRICCPYCGDKRFRCYIRHIWGSSAFGSNSLNLHLIKCFNENCFHYSHPHGIAHRKDLYNRVLSGFYAVVDTTIVEEKPVPEPQCVCVPGIVTPLTQLSDKHPAVQYLTERQYDIGYLTETFDVGFVFQATDEKNMAMQGRIFIPIRMDGQLVGYQGRYVGSPPYKSIPKYIMNAGAARSHFLYNFDLARQSEYTVILEGATKVWRFGREAIATFGKEINLAQLNIIANNWSKVAVFLDQNARRNAVSAADFLRTSGVETVVIDYDGPEPDEIPTDKLREIVFNELSKICDVPSK